MNEDDKNSTSNALLEQLVYIDTFVNNGGGSGDLTPNFNVDSQLSLDLAAFADDSFIFPDEDKPKVDSDDDDDDLNGNMNQRDRDDHQNHQNHHHNHNDHNNQNSHINQNNHNNHNNHNQNNQNIHNNQNNHNNNHLINPDQFRHIKKEEPTNGNTLDSNVANPDISNLPKFPVPPGAKNSLVSAGLSTNQIDLISALVAQHQQILGNSIPQNGSSNTSPLPFNNPPQLLSQNYYRNNNNNNNDKNNTSSNDNNINGNSNQVQASNGMNQIFLGNFDDQLAQITSSSSSFLSTGISPNFNQIMSPNFSDETPTNTSAGGQTPINSSEYDKRRRNTAASARFRIKKKIKEQQMETRIQQLSNIIKEYEAKIQQYDMENKLLRNLIIEKGTRKSEDELQKLKEKARRN